MTWDFCFMEMCYCKIGGLDHWATRAHGLTLPPSDPTPRHPDRLLAGERTGSRLTD